jgi:hypothetical protein
MIIVRVDGGIVFVKDSDTHYERSTIGMLNNTDGFFSHPFELNAMLIKHKLWCPRYNVSGTVHFFDPDTVTFVCDNSKFVFYQDEDCTPCLEVECECLNSVSLPNKIKQAVKNVQIPRSS